jgi:hypothetical protein
MSSRCGSGRAPLWLAVLVLSYFRSDPAEASEPNAPQTARPSIYLSCTVDCSEPYLRQELSYFDFARDRFLADYVIIVVEQPNGAGGRRVTVRLAPRVDAPPLNVPHISFSLPSGATPDDLRGELKRSILHLLYQALRSTPHRAAFELALKPRDPTALSSLRDPWNYWVFSPEIKGTGEGGSGYYFVELTGALTIRRVTESWRHRTQGAYTRNLNSYELENGTRIRGDVESWRLRSLEVRSLGRHWGLGVLATGSASRYENLAGHVHGGIALEYNVFPYTENASKQLRLVYQGGPWANWYLEENTLGVMNELRPYHAFSTIVDVNQPWGSVSWIGQANQFLDDPRLFRLSTGATIALKLVEGLALNLTGQLSLIEDFINLRARPITDEELLLWTAQQPTTFGFNTEFGLSYTFGSRHNTIVNPRFARLDLEEE